MITYNMFSNPPTKGPKLEALYHKGQARAWDGKATLKSLLLQHGMPKLPEGQHSAVKDLFAVLMWGELAAWNISSELACAITPLEAKMAVTAQAHDEARHFYVMRDYLLLLGPLPERLKPKTDALFNRVLKANTTAKMLLGMQLMVEPMALTLFKLVKKRVEEPVLGGLLEKIEVDEARHVGLGTMYLPDLINAMSPLEKGSLAAWQMRMYSAQFEMLKELSPSFEALGFTAREVFELGRNKQVQAIKILAQELGRAVPMANAMLRTIDFRAEIEFPREASLKRRLAAGYERSKSSPKDLE